jgi:enoyl-CoA hydratase/carnithine racemase
MAPAGQLVVEHPAEGVTLLRIERPERRGALSAEILEALCRAFAGASEGCVVLTGTGEIFSAGYDLSGIGDPVDAELADAAIAPDEVPALEELRACRVPVLCALNGPALGGGLELALGCDIRFAVPGAYLAAPAGKLGLTYSVRGLERILAGMPASAAAELFVLGRRVEAERAHALGVVSELAEPGRLIQVALAAAEEVLGQSPRAVRSNARALRELRLGVSPETRAVLDAARREGMRSADFAEGVAAFRGRRPPRWES